MFVPAIIRLLFDFKERSRMKKTPEENKVLGENAGKVHKKKNLCSKICFGTLNAIVKFVVLIMFLIHFAVIGFNLYVQGWV